MVFSSLLFVFAFLSLNLLIYFTVSKKYRNHVLLVFSLIFYSWGGPKYLFLLLAETFVSFICAKGIQNSHLKHKTGKQYIIIENVTLLGLLGIFKYLGFVLDNIKLITGADFVAPGIALPIGISFYTFQLISYVVDVYRGEVIAQRSYFKLLLYSSLFHQCIAGPIVRYKTVAESIDKRQITTDDIFLGIRRFSVGLAKKAILANSCASIADTLLPAGIDNLKTQSVLGLWLGVICYTLQIYLDFSAYSDMAIGMGRMVGFRYDENFRYPYIATSVKDFWRRWHISLSSFFRDYVYIPLGGNRRGVAKYVRNMAVVWLLTGMWHGASWNFLLWGLYYLIFLLLENFVIKGKMPIIINHIYTMFIVIIGWAIFRFDNMEELWVVLKGMFGATGAGFVNLATKTEFIGNIFLLIVSVIACTPIGKLVRRKTLVMGKKNNAMCIAANTIDVITPTVLLVLSALALMGASYNPFLYFRF